MLYAKFDNEKIEAIPNTRAKCPLCEEEVFSRCGEVNIWHWAHLQEQACDNWYEPETEWHKEWKNQFGKEFSEIVITQNGKRHFADIRTRNDIVIELQNSDILKPIIRQRELFYGEKMLWIINGAGFKPNFNIISGKDRNYFYEVSNGFVHRSTGQLLKHDENFFIWKWCRKSWSEAQRPVFIDFGEDHLFFVKTGMGYSSGTGKYINKETFIKKYR